MTNEICESLDRLQKLDPANLTEVRAAFNPLINALQKDVQAQTMVLTNHDPESLDHVVASTSMVNLLELMNAVLAARTEYGKLAGSAARAMQRVLKKIPNSDT